MPLLHQRPALRACLECCEHFAFDEAHCPHCGSPAPHANNIEQPGSRASQIRRALGVSAAAALLAHGLSACVTAKYGCGEGCGADEGGDGDSGESSETADLMVSDVEAADANAAPSKDASARIGDAPATGKPVHESSPPSKRATPRASNTK